MAFRGGVDDALYNRLVGNTVLQNKLGERGDGQPAIYKERPIPEDTETPFIFMGDFPVANPNAEYDSKTNRSQMLLNDIKVYCDKDDTFSTIQDMRDAAQEVYDILDDREFDNSELDGNHSNPELSASYPTTAANSADRMGYIISLTIQLQEK